MLGRVMLLCLGCLITFSSTAIVIVPPDSTWRYFRGYSEGSAPDASAWRDWGFAEIGWTTGQAAFYYENQPGSPNAYTGNTPLTDMFGGYTCIFLRRTFVLSNVHDVASLQVAARSDDGCIAWINGHEVARFNMPEGDVAFWGAASPALAEPISWRTNTLPGFPSFLLKGTNVFAIQAFNSSLGDSSDYFINAALYYTPDLSSPTMTSRFPAPNAVVRELVSVEIVFNEPVAGVEASDLRLNGQPATNLTVLTTSHWLFEFPPPPTGLVQVAWAPGHGIRDLSNASN